MLGGKAPDLVQTGVGALAPLVVAAAGGPSMTRGEATLSLVEHTRRYGPKFR